MALVASKSAVRAEHRRLRPCGHPAAEAAVAVWVAQEVDDLGQLGLGVVDAGHLVEHDPDRRRIDPPGLRASEVFPVRRRLRPWPRGGRRARTGR